MSFVDPSRARVPGRVFGVRFVVLLLRMSMRSRPGCRTSTVATRLGENFVGPPDAPMRSSLTRLAPSVDRSELENV